MMCSMSECGIRVPGKHWGEETRGMRSSRFAVSCLSAVGFGCDRDERAQGAP